ncbi:MAG: three-Cys-motif partner protein TcmP [Pseudomonadota bacterium]
MAYNWGDGAKLDEHTKRKHKVLREYFREYLVTRCQIRHRERFRVAIIDGFAGAGRYACGTPGSPLIFLETLDRAVREINFRRAAEGTRPIQIECFAVFNDKNPAAISELRTHTARLIEGIRSTNKDLHIRIEFFDEEFEVLYPRIKSFLSDGCYQNVIFNLDQYGYSNVNMAILSEIMVRWASAEIFLTFAIETLLTYFPSNEAKNYILNDEPGLKKEIYAFLQDGGEVINKREWLGAAEQIVYEQLKLVAPFVSTFSIHNPDGWRYWLIHFANHSRARQVYNDILHENSTSQAHFGRSGLNMLSFNPAEDGMLYLFTDEAREQAIKQLHEDIPNKISEHGDSLGVEEFHLCVYKETPAHSRDINKVIIESDDLEVRTPTGGERRTAHTIKTVDTIRLKRQRSFFPMFPRKV